MDIRDGSRYYDGGINDNYFDASLPSCILDCYEPISCIMNTNEKKIYLAEEKENHSRVIIKYAAETVMGALREEANTLDLLLLTCLPKKVDFKETSSGGFLVREYVPGESLLGKIQNYGSFSEERAVHITLEVCDMLQDMVRCNLCVANPTIDAQNILCMDNGKLKLVDMEGSTYSEEADEQISLYIKALGNLLSFLLTAKENPTMQDYSRLSLTMRKVIRRCKNTDQSDSFHSLEELGKTLRANTKEVSTKKKQAICVVAAVAFTGAITLSLPYIPGMTGVTGSTGLKVANRTDTVVVIDDGGMPAADVTPAMDALRLTDRQLKNWACWEAILPKDQDDEVAKYLWTNPCNGLEDQNK